ncbi:MAG TPA: shikimate dehydrogenase [Candidatus Dormibacteraeota bacterium]|nr:shikimate dehydrogenase [Candidatus Dormibacteraeota bacterium]
MTLRLCLAGAAVGRSPSAAMYTAVLRELGVDGSYELRPLREAELPTFLAELRAGRYRGCNVTMPYKGVLAKACDELSPDAELLGAANTINVEDGRLIGSNTDIAGFAGGLDDAGLLPGPDARAVVLGAGGAAAAVTLALLRVPVAQVTVVARRVTEADALAARVVGEGSAVAGVWDARELRGTLDETSILVNATPAGVAELPLDVRALPSSCTVADVRYRPRPVDLVVAAAAAGLPAVDGSGMLVHQAVLSFRTWTGLTAPPATMRRALEAALEG